MATDKMKEKLIDALDNLSLSLQADEAHSPAEWQAVMIARETGQYDAVTVRESSAGGQRENRIKLHERKEAEMSEYGVYDTKDIMNDGDPTARASEDFGTVIISCGSRGTRYDDHLLQLAGRHPR